MNSAAAKEVNMKLEEIHIAYLIYFATGEGVSIFVAVGSGYVEAERVFKRNVPEYFHVGMKVQPRASEDVEMAYVIKLLPKAVLKLFKRNPPRTTEYFSIVHYNLFC